MNTLMIVGIDEVGRGPWAGPLAFGAVVLGGAAIDGLTDSKKLTAKRREALDPVIRSQAVSFGLGWVSAAELDAVGMSAACTLACRRALEQITVPYHEIIIDGTVNFLKDTGKGPYVTTMKQADLLVPSVSAASVLAKVARDRYMTACDSLFPGYGFASHVGYGTAKHVLALQTLGLTSLHRRSFAPVAAFLGQTPELVVPSSIDGTTRDTGNRSEDVAAARLRDSGFLVVERNWKTKLCEIDIVAQKDDTWFFVEVKHRKGNQQGGGVGAITPRKLAQMRFAAGVYVHVNHLDAPLRLMVMTTGGPAFSVIDCIELDD